MVQVSRDGFTGFTAHVLSNPEISAVRVWPVRSGGGWVIRKLIKSVVPSHIVTSPVRSGDSSVGGFSGAEEASTVGEANKVGDSAGVGEALSAAGVGVLKSDVSEQSL
jgi:hypothetical protein